MYEALLVRKEIEKPNPSLPESFLALIRELHALGLNFSIKKFENGFYSTTNIKETEKDIFKELETRLKLRALLARKKAEQFAKSTHTIEKLDNLTIEKALEKKKILDKLKLTKDKL
jgi:EAL domain-containing protein (putative c-di-GMP-specific phosphodiesterase class I)